MGACPLKIISSAIYDFKILSFANTSFVTVVPLVSGAKHVQENQLMTLFYTSRLGSTTRLYKFSLGL